MRYSLHAILFGLVLVGCMQLPGQAEPDPGISYCTVNRVYRRSNRLTVEQSLAAALTQTAVLLATQADRRYLGNSPRCEIEIRGSRLRLIYQRSRGHEILTLLAGSRIRWKIVDGQWAGGRVSGAYLDGALSVLERNGFSFVRASITTSSLRDQERARELARYLGIAHLTLITWSAQEEPHATIVLQGPEASFARNN